MRSEYVGIAGVTKFKWDKKGRILELCHSTYTESDFTYNKAGNLLSYQHDDTQEKFSFDDHYHLISEDGSAKHTYQYDSLGNRTQDGLNTYFYNALNQRNESEYDSCGNLLKHQDMHFEYDSFDRLVKVRIGKQEYHYEYDSFNRRVSKYQKGERRDYIYHENNEIGSAVNSKIDELRVLGKGITAEMGAAVLLELKGKVYVQIHNYRDDVKLLIDPLTRKIPDRSTYSAYGMEYGSLEVSPWRFQSKRVDPETKFLNFGRRYYCPERGTWLTPDPLGLEAGPNLYAYVNANPLTHLDEHGLFAIELAVKKCGSYARNDLKIGFDYIGLPLNLSPAALLNLFKLSCFDASYTWLKFSV